MKEETLLRNVIFRGLWVDLIQDFWLLFPGCLWTAASWWRKWSTLDLIWTTPWQVSELCSLNYLRERDGSQVNYCDHNPSVVCLYVELFFHKFTRDESSQLNYCDCNPSVVCLYVELFFHKFTQGEGSQLNYFDCNPSIVCIISHFWHLFLKKSVGLWSWSTTECSLATLHLTPGRTG